MSGIENGFAYRQAELPIKEEAPIGYRQAEFHFNYPSKYDTVFDDSLRTSLESFDKKILPLLSFPLEVQEATNILSEFRSLNSIFIRTIFTFVRQKGVVELSRETKRSNKLSKTTYFFETERSLHAFHAIVWSLQQNLPPDPYSPIPKKFLCKRAKDALGKHPLKEELYDPFESKF